MIDVGSRVVISRDSIYYNTGLANPADDVVGTVTTTHREGMGHPYCVDWDNGNNNSYREGDLIEISQEELSEAKEIDEEFKKYKDGLFRVSGVFKDKSRICYTSFGVDTIHICSVLKNESVTYQTKELKKALDEGKVNIVCIERY